MFLFESSNMRVTAIALAKAGACPTDLSTIALATVEAVDGDGFRNKNLKRVIVKKVIKKVV